MWIIKDENYLMHADEGTWKKHKYIDKIKTSKGWQYIYETSQKVGNGVKSTANKIGTGAKSAYNAASTAAKNAYGSTSRWVSETGKKVGNTIYEKSGYAAKDRYNANLAEGKRLSSVLKTAPNFQAKKNVTRASNENYNQMLKNHNSYKNSLAGRIDDVKKGINNLSQKASSWFNKLGESTKKLFANVSNKAKEAYARVSGTFSKTVSELSAKAKDFEAKVKSGATAFAAKFNKMANETVDNLSEKYKDGIERGKALFDSIGDKIGDAADKVGDTATDIYDKAKAGVQTVGKRISKMAGDAGEAAKRVYDNVAKKVDSAIDAAGDFTAEKAKNAKEFIMDKIDEAEDFLANEVMPALKAAPGEAKEILDDASEYLRDMFKVETTISIKTFSLDDFAEKVSNGDIELNVDGMEKLLNECLSKGSDLTNDLLNKFLRK